jgi:hypothetical protein
MKRCKHENAEHLMPGECVATMDGIVFVDPAQCEQFRCLDCRAWLSLGPANDEPDAVRVEILGARFAVDYDRPSKAGPCPFDECDLCQARHLSDVIRGDAQ